MIEKCLEMAEFYDVSVNKAIRGRGAVKDKGFENVDNIVKTKEGGLVAKDEFETMYILKDWCVGKDCNARSEVDVVRGVEILATLHNITENVEILGDSNFYCESPLEEYERHNVELKRVKNYIRSKKKKVEFEYDILRHFDEYYSYAVEATISLKKTDIEAMIEKANSDVSICHGNYNYHNIIFLGNNCAVTDFDRSGKGLLVKDLYFYLRKVMEKHNWDLKIGYNILDKYNKIRPMSQEENRILKIMLMYPEKFWKVVNQYYNSNKSWIPDKNVEKLRAVYEGQLKKEEFIKKMW